MATGLLLSSGSPLIGSPIVYRVTSDAVNIADVSFHRVVIEVTAGLSGGNYTTIKFSSAVGNSQTVQIDISSALRTVADNYTFTPVPPESYPYIAFSLAAWDEYLVNGELHDKANIIYNEGGRALFGAYSDLERLLSSGSKTTNRFTRKPFSPEIVCVGEQYVRPATMAINISNIEKGPSSVVYDITTPGLQILGGAEVYALPSGQLDRYELRFINGLGCMESVSVSSLRSTEIAITSDEYAISRTENFQSFSRNIIRKKNDFESWNLSSGPLDNAWQSWFLHEFLMAKWVWIKIDGVWIPCHIKTEETINGINRVDGSLIEVLFTVQLDISGSPYTSLAI